MKKGPVPPKTIQRKTPVAPPAYRPMPVPLVLQRKMAVAGPKVNKPAPVPHVLQRKEIKLPVPVKPTPNPLVQRKQAARPGLARPGILQPKVIQRAKWSMGQSDDDMSNMQWAKSGMVTYVSIMVDDDELTLSELGLGKSLKTKTYGAEHAEDVAMRALLSAYGEDGLEGLNVILNLSKSPCSSDHGTSGLKDPGCTENLIAFKKKYKLSLTLICRGLYKGLEASQEAVETLRAAGIAVSVDVRVGREERFGEHKG